MPLQRAAVNIVGMLIKCTLLGTRVKDVPSLSNLLQAAYSTERQVEQQMLGSLQYDPVGNTAVSANDASWQSFPM